LGVVCYCCSIPPYVELLPAVRAPSAHPQIPNFRSGFESCQPRYPEELTYGAIGNGFASANVKEISMETETKNMLVVLPHVVPKAEPSHK